MSSLYVVSSREFKSLKEAEKQIIEWDEEGELDLDARVYEVKRVYEPKFKLKLVERKQGRPRKS